MSTQIRSFDILPGKVATVPDGEVWYIVDLTNAAIDQTEALETTREDLDEKTYVTSGTRIYTTGAKGRVSYILFDTADSTAVVSDDAAAPTIDYSELVARQSGYYYYYDGTITFTTPNGFDSVVVNEGTHSYYRANISDIKVAEDGLSGSFKYNSSFRGNSTFTIILTDQLGKVATVVNTQTTFDGISWNNLSSQTSKGLRYDEATSDLPGALLDEWVTATVEIKSPNGIVPPGTFTGGHSDCVQISGDSTLVQSRITDRVINWDTATITMEYKWISYGSYGSSSYYDIDSTNQYITMTVDTSKAADEPIRIPIVVDKGYYDLDTPYDNNNPFEIDYVESDTVEGSVDFLLDIPFKAKYGIHTITVDPSNNFARNFTAVFDEDATSGNVTISGDLTKNGPGLNNSFSPAQSYYSLNVKVYFKDEHGNKRSAYEQRTIYYKGVIVE